MNFQLDLLKTLLRLGEDSHADETRIGRKAANLNQLLQQGFPVPPGICITIDAFRAAITPFEQLIAPLLKAVTTDDPAQAVKLSLRINSILEDLSLPASLLDEIWHAIRPLWNGSFAVRSSATLEDLSGASFAGQYRSTLGVSSQREIEKAVLDCWRSYYSPNAVAARAGYTANVVTGLAPEAHGMAVLIQPLIDAECSGVCFSVDPVHLQAENILVVSTWGQGIGVVDGTVPADTSIVHRSDLSIDSAIVVEKFECIRLLQEGGLRRVAVPGNQRGIACLPDHWLQRIAQFGLAIEQAMGFPQDMEWAIAGQQMWVLQSRPITTLPTDLATSVRFPIEWANEAEPRHLWWLEHVNDRPETCLLPIEIEFVNISTEGGQAAVEYGGSVKTRWRKQVNGRIYIAIADSPVRPADRRIRSAAKDDLFRRLQDQKITQWEHWGPEIICATERLAAFNPQGADGQTLADYFEDTMAVARRHWMIHTLVPRQGFLTPLIDTYRQISGKNKQEAGQDIQFLIQGAETIQTRLIEALYDLAQLAQKTPPVAALLSARPVDIVTRLHHLTEARPFLDKLEQLMRIYGCRLCYQSRNGGSVMLPVPWQEAPEHVLEMIAAYLPQSLDKDILSPKVSKQRADREYQHQIEALVLQAQDPNTVEEFRQRLAYARRNAAFTDEHNHYIDQLAEGQFIQAAIHAGRWLAARGDVDEFEDVYWLLPDEITTALRTLGKHDLSKKARDRKVQLKSWKQLLAPVSLGLPETRLPERTNEITLRAFEPKDGAPQSPEGKYVLTGNPCSLGFNQGRARVIAETDILPDIAPGDVLVAKNAGPTWTPVFGMLAGIVLDQGYAGAHAAITAREFGIPAVFGAKHATRCIPEGTWVTVDGTRGIVEWKIR